MSLKIRLARGGAKKRPIYRIVIADSKSPRDGRFIERVGTYSPMLAKEDPARTVLVTERIQHWLKVGALPTDRVARMLSAVGLVAAPARPAQTKKDKPRAKAQERLKEAQAASEAAAATPAAPAEAAPSS